MPRPGLISLLTLLVAASALRAADLRKTFDKPPEWFQGPEGRTLVANVLSWQTPIGGWAKGYKNEEPHPDGARYGGWSGTATFDNGATYTELRFLAHAFTATGDPAVRDAFHKGLQFLFTSQYPSGGWPQRYPPPDDDYGRHITFNDNAMTSVMRLLLDVSRGGEPFAFVDPALREQARASFDRGIDCILKAQVVVDGKPTGWCAQHDADTLRPAQARSYELPSLSGSEGSGIAVLLMDIENPSPEVKSAVEGAVAWFKQVRIDGKRVEKIDDPEKPGKKRNVLVDDPEARPLWARFYEIGTDRPFFCNRDGVKLYSYDELDQERSMGYAWFGHWGEKVEKAYEQWRQKQGG